MLHFSRRFRPICMLLAAVLVLEAAPISVARAEDEVVVRNVRFESSGQVIVILYDLQGPTESKFAVKLLLKRRSDPAFEFVPASLSGDIGEGRFAGTDRRIVWEMQKDSPGGFEGTDYYFVVEANLVSSRTSILWYIGGGAAVAVGAAAVILLKGTQNGGSTTPDAFPRPVGRPGGN